MKNIKKLTILLLSLVMAFSCLAIFALAADGGDEAKAKEIEALLEYYNEEGIYVCDTFDNANVGSALTFDEDTAGEYATVDGKSVFAATLDGKNVLYSQEIAVPDDIADLAIVYSFRVSAGVDKGYLALEFSGSSQTEDATDAQSVLVFDYNEGKAYFASMNANTVLSSQEIAGFIPEDGAWYTVSMIYNRKANTFVGKVAAEGGEEYAFEYNLTGLAGLAVLQLRSRNLGNEGVTVAWDLLEVYEGSFFRSNLAGERQKYLDSKLLEYMLAYEDSSDAVKAAVVKVVDALMEKGYVPAAGSDTEAYFNNTFNEEIVKYNWERFVSKVDAFDSSLKFDDRNKALADAKAPDADFPARPSGISEQYYNAMIDKYNAEADALAVIGEHSQNLIDMVPALGSASDYAMLLESLLAFEAEREYLLGTDGSYDDTYFGLTIAIDIYHEALNKFVTAKQSALSFIAAVDAMQNVAGNNFGLMYNAYNTARVLMSDASFAFIRDSYFASLVFDTVGGVDGIWYDGRFYAIDSVAENGKSASLTINHQPYTITLENYNLILEGEGMRIVFDTLESGTELDGSWSALQTVAKSCALFEERAKHIETGMAACQDLISEISIALVAKTYNVRVEKCAGVLEKFEAIRSQYEEGGKYFGFPGVAEALAEFDAFCAKIDAYKAKADQYIALVEQLKTATAYADIFDLIEALTPLYAVVNELGFEGYENEASSVQDANLIYNANKNVVVEAEGYALEFAAKVNEAAATDDLNARLAALRAAQKLYAKLMDGATGVAEAKALFAAEKASYLADASAMNESAKEQGEALVGIALANVKFTSSQKLVFIVKKVYEL